MHSTRKFASPRGATLLTAFGITFVITLYFLCRRSERGLSPPKPIANDHPMPNNGAPSSISSSNIHKFTSLKASGTAPSVQGPSRATLRGAMSPFAAPPVGRRPPLTVVCVSDTHGLHQQEGLIKVPPADMLLFAGDAGIDTAAEGLAFSRWLEGLAVRGPRVVTWGNMDTGTIGAGKTDLVPAATVITNSIREVNGYRIFASPWTPRFAGTYQLHVVDQELDRYWAQLLPPDSDVDIIVTHGPPFGVADLARGRNRGDPGLLKAVQALHTPPLLWVCGHIHEQYGAYRLPHPRAPHPDGILLLNSAVFYLQRAGGGHQQRAQPRVVRLPEGELVTPA